MITQQSRKQAVARTRWGVSALLAGTMVLASSLAACGPAAEPQPYEVEQLSSAATSSQWDTFKSTVSQLFDEGKKIGSYFSTVGSVISAADTIGHLLGLLDPPVDEVAVLSQKLDQVANGLGWQVATSERARDYSNVLGAVDTLSLFVNTGMTYTVNSPGYQDSITGTLNSGQPPSFLRVFSEQATDGPPVTSIAGTATFPWKQVVSDRATVTNGVVFDWRMAAPLLVKMVGMRLSVMNAVDANFRTDHDFDTEIKQHRDALLSAYTTMVGGVRCGSHAYETGREGPPLIVASGASVRRFYWNCQLTCADIYSGLNSTSFLDEKIDPLAALSQNYCFSLQGTQPYKDMTADLAAGTKKQMGLYQIRYMTDLLSRYLVGGPDLSEVYQQIEGEVGIATNRLCIDANLGLPLPQFPTLLACDGTNAQWWTYNRETGQISNPSVGTCLAGGPRPGTGIITQVCATPQGDPPQIDDRGQQWIYDPVRQTVQNAFGMVMATGTQRPAVGSNLKNDVLQFYRFDTSFNIPSERWHADADSDPFP